MAAVKITANWSGTMDDACRRKIDTMAGKTLDTLDELGSEAAGIMRTLAPVLTGNYRAGITSRRDVVGRRIGVNAKSMAPHAHLVEVGRKPGKMPPTTTIGPKLGIASASPRTFVIARAIGRKKTKGRRVASRARRAMKGRLAAESVQLAAWLNDLDAT